MSDGEQHRLESDGARAALSALRKLATGAAHSISGAHGVGVGGRLGRLTIAGQTASSLRKPGMPHMPCRHRCVRCMKQRQASHPASDELGGLDELAGPGSVAADGLAGVITVNSDGQMGKIRA
jgi:hypothetical protein